MKAREVGALDYEGLYDACYMQVYSFLLTLSRDRNLAEELTAQTFYKAMTAKSAFRLCAIAKNLYADEQRRRARQSAMEPEQAPVQAAAMEEGALDRDMAFRIHMVLHDMPEPYKEVFQLRVFGELAFRQIGEIFGKTETWARVTYHRARLKIQERMEAEENE